MRSVNKSKRSLVNSVRSLVNSVRTLVNSMHTLVKSMRTIDSFFKKPLKNYHSSFLSAFSVNGNSSVC
jgi:hypothetical protein